MDYVFLLAGTAIILTCFYFIISPFFSANREAAAGGEEWEGRLTLDLVYGAVNELEMDYLMKKIKEEDFYQLKEQYQLLAAELLKLESRPKEKTSLGNYTEKDELELLRELQKLRKQKGR